MGFIEIDFENEIQKLNPVTWIYNNDPSNSLNIGYIAEELNQIPAFEYLVEKEFDGTPKGIRYEMLSVYLVEALKVAYKRIDALESKINLL